MTANRNWRHSILFAIMLAAALSVSVIILVSNLVSFFLEEGRLSTTLHNHAQLMGDLQAAAIGQPMWDLDNERVQRLAEALAQDPDFQSARVTDANNPDKAIAAHALPDRGFGQISSTHPILNPEDPEQQIGTLYLTLSRENVAKAKTQALIFGIVQFLIVNGIILGVLFVSVRRVTQPLTGLTRLMGRLADGDTGIDIKWRGRRDEIGDVARAVQIFKDNAIAKDGLEKEQSLQRQKDVERTDRVESASVSFQDEARNAMAELDVSMRVLGELARDLGTQSKAAGHQTSQVAEAANRSSSRIQQVGDAIGNISDAMEEIGHKVATSTGITGQAVQEADRASTEIRELAEVTGRIGEVIKLISDIAEQTNLLALNATIEAARAGEAGKGFAVVAGEVKSLANQTHKATDEIASQITAVQNRTHDAVDAINRINGTIEELSSISSTIATTIGDQTNSIHEIVNHVDSVADEATGVLSMIDQVAEAQGAATGVSQQTLKAIDVMAHNQERLNGSIDRFITQVTEA